MVPHFWYINKKYKCYRLDREDKGGGGELVFLKKEYIPSQNKKKESLKNL
jgi:hypothetical protein